jgi:hypothetical protein
MIHRRADELNSVSEALGQNGASAADVPQHRGVPLIASAAEYPPSCNAESDQPDPAASVLALATAPSQPNVCWDRELLVRAGYTPASGCEADFGVPRDIRAIVWHSMECYFDRAIELWNTGVAAAHLCILRTGTVVLTCALEDVAWHAGTHGRPGVNGYGRTPFWRQNNINPYSCGIELEGPGARGFSEAQIEACIRIGRWLTARYAIPAEHTVNRIDGHHLHSEVSGTRVDPGPYFPLGRVLGAIRDGQSSTIRTASEPTGLDAPQNLTEGDAA